MTREFGAFSKGAAGWGLDSMVGCSTIAIVVIAHRILFSIFEAIDTTELWAVANALCTNYSSYCMLYLMRFPTSFPVRLVITEVSKPNLDSRRFQCAHPTSSGIPSTPNPNTYLLTSW